MEALATDRQTLATLKGLRATVDHSMAVIECAMDGTIVSANNRFLDTTGYDPREITGRSYARLVDPAFAAGAAYADFWNTLNGGTPYYGEFEWRGSEGNPLWFDGACTPVLDDDGTPIKVLLVARDITAKKLDDANTLGHIKAINRSLSVIEYDLDGNILATNRKFQEAVGYGESEIRGKHHSMFVRDEFVQSPAYREFWENLKRGGHASDEYRHLGKNGKVLWLQATYCPILDLGGKPFKVVEYATDITAQKTLRDEIERMVGETRDVMLAVSEGSLDRQMGRFEGDFAALGESINACIDKLTQIVRRINAGAGTISERAKQTAGACKSLSERTQDQAGGIEETAAVMEQMSATIQKNAENVHGANQLADEMKQQAARGGDVIRQVIDIMQFFTLRDA